MARQKHRYEDLGTLARAFVAGELDRRNYTLKMESDVSYLAYTGPMPEGMEPGTPAYDDWWLKQEAEARKLFRGHGTADIVDACNAAGIPTDWV